MLGSRLQRPRRSLATACRCTGCGSPLRAFPGAALVALTSFALRDLPLPVPVLAGALVYAAASEAGGLSREAGDQRLRRTALRAGPDERDPSGPNGWEHAGAGVRARAELPARGAARAVPGTAYPCSSHLPRRSWWSTAATTRRRSHSCGIGPPATRRDIVRSLSRRRESSTRCRQAPTAAAGDVVAFIDDDAVPRLGWLKELSKRLQRPDRRWRRRSLRGLRRRP